MNRKLPEPDHRINERITGVSEVRLVGEDETYNNKIVTIAQALEMARIRELDLVEIAPKAVPPVCRIVEYSKFRYELKKKEKENKSKQHTVVVKEIRFGPNTDDHDFQFKLKHAYKFLQEGHKIKAFVVFHGRTIVYKQRGETLLNEFAQALEELCKIESPPKMEGKRMYLLLAPKKLPT
jgi:translation initiation factor IF-3